MLTPPRWEAECRLMHTFFPAFEAYAEPGLWAGFRGRLRGKRTGTLYNVVIRASIRKYPAEEPRLLMDPRPEGHHWFPDGRLCFQWGGHHWNPAEDTFARTLIVAVKYLDEFDGKG
jgi:hypothetical protein